MEETSVRVFPGVTLTQPGATQEGKARLEIIGRAKIVSVEKLWNYCRLRGARILNAEVKV